MEATPSPASPVPEGAAPPGTVAAPAASAPAEVPAERLRLALGLAAGFVALALAFAGYRLYEKDRAETAAELVRIKAYLDARSQPETVPARARERARASGGVLVAADEPQARKPVEPQARKPVEPAARTVPKPRPAKEKPPSQPRPKPVQSKPPPPAERPKSVDRIWNERVQRECARGFVGLICRESLRMDLCKEHAAWGKASICPAEKPAPPSWPSSVG